MKIFKLGDFTEETLDRFTDFSNAYWEEEWCIYLHCSGGSTWIRGQIDQILSKKLLEPTTCYLNVIMAYSSGFISMMNFTGHINIINDSRAMIHQKCSETTLNGAGNEMNHASSNYGEMMYKHNKLSYKKDLLWCETFMTEKELKDYKDGKDIYYSEEQLLSLVKKRNYV